MQPPPDLLSDNICRLRGIAAEEGRSKFAFWKPCRYSHVAWRLTANMNCCECRRLRAVERARQQVSKIEQQLRVASRLSHTRQAIGSIEERLQMARQVLADLEGASELL